MRSLAFLFLVGCSSRFAGVWWVEQELLIFGDDACTASIDENFIDAEPAGDTVTTTVSDWVYSADIALSADGYFVEVFDGKGDTAWVIVDGAAYPATIANGSLHAEWINYQDSTESESHSSGYAWESDVVIEIITALDMTPGEGGVLTGSVSQTTAEDSSWSESDRWDTAATGLLAGQIAAYSYQYLTGTGIVNDPDSDQCTQTPCTLAVNQTCSASAALTAEWVDASTEAFDGFQDAGQDPGVL